VLNGSFKGKLFKTVADFADDYGNRLSGSQALERSIDGLVDSVRSAGLKDVTTEEFTMLTWKRNEESATVLKPRELDMNILGLGWSVQTPPEGITAEVLVVRSFEELEQKSHQAKGKIVAFVREFEGYYEVSVKYTVEGASRAANVGAVAALVRSLASFSIDSPHVHIQRYFENSTKIPVAAITLEDADRLDRLDQRGKSTTVKLVLRNEVRNSTTRNTIIEYRGQSLPEQKVLVSGHIDSWDVGDGVMDDGAGAILSWFVPHVLNTLGLRPRRTVQTVLFSGEEQGLLGAHAFRNRRLDELKDYVIMMEADFGTFDPKGFEFSGSNTAACIFKEIQKHLAPLQADGLTMPHVGSDIAVFDKDGIPQATLSTRNDKYFWFHHTEGDTVRVLNSDELDRCLAVWTVATYIIADLGAALPRE
jgi:carboxypeptidase Q